MQGVRWKVEEEGGGGGGGEGNPAAGATRKEKRDVVHRVVRWWKS